MNLRRVLMWPVLALIVLLAAGCSGWFDGSDGGAGGTPDDGPVRVAVVADSEIPTEIADLLGEQDGIEVISASSANGAKMAELDPTVAEALEADPDVLVWSGGTNDLGANPYDMLAGVEERLARYAERGCVVFAVPVFRYEQGTPSEIAVETAGTRLLEEAAVEAGAVVASYLDVSLAMAEEDRYFFAEGELGNIHPGAQSYPDIAEAIGEAVDRCPPPSS